MKWIEALREYNKGKSKWCIPRKGSDDYNAVKAIMEGKHYVPPAPKTKSRYENLLEFYASSPEMWKRAPTKEKHAFYEQMWNIEKMSPKASPKFAEVGYTNWLVKSGMLGKK